MWLLALLFACDDTWSVGDYAQGRAEVWCGRMAECYALSPDETCEDEAFDTWMSQLDFELEYGCTFDGAMAEACVENLWSIDCPALEAEPEICDLVMICE